MNIPEDLAIIARQEAELVFPSFDYDTAWRLGLTLRELALTRNHSIVIDIRRFGQPHQQLIDLLLAHRVLGAASLADVIQLGPSGFPRAGR